MNGIEICGASSYTRKYYLNPVFSRLPEEIRKDLRRICIGFVEDVGGAVLFLFDEDGSLQILTQAEGDDFSYDEIGSELKIRQLQREKRELFQSLELYYQTFIAGD